MRSSTILAVFVTIFFLVWATIRIVSNIQYYKGCSGYLERAGNANTVERADEELGKALKYLKDNNMTMGYTSVVYNTPDEDVGFWYSNLSDAKGELEIALKNKNLSQLEASNVLMKLKETLTDNGESGTSITQPTGISVFPHNTLLGVFGIVSAILLVLCWAIWLADLQM